MDVTASMPCNVCGSKSEVPNGVYSTVGNRIIVESINNPDLELLHQLKIIFARSIRENKPVSSDESFKTNSSKFLNFLGISPEDIKSLKIDTKINIYMAVLSSIAFLGQAAGYFKDEDPKVIHQHIDNSSKYYYDVPIKELLKRQDKTLQQRNSDMPIQYPKKKNQRA